MSFAEVAVDAPWTQQRTFSYSVPNELSVQAAQSVWVPFGRRVLQGIVYEIGPTSAVEETKDVISVIDPSPLLSQAQLNLARWISGRYLTSLFDATALMLPAGFRRRILTFFSIAPVCHDKPSSPGQKRVFDYVQRRGTVELESMKKGLGVKAVNAAERMAKKGILNREWRWARPKIGPKYVNAVRLAIDKDEAAIQMEALRKKRATRRSALIGALIDHGGPLSYAELRGLDIDPSVARELEKQGLVIIDRIRVHRDPLGYKSFQRSSQPRLTRHQQEAWQTISDSMDRGEARPFLLYGVTGSGKTEIYLRALEKAVALGKRGLVLVPEISLTPQTIDRFGSRFPNKVAVLHSRLSLGERFDEWWRIKEGQFDVVIGSRSAAFAPQPDLGLIVLDEEHDAAYKQADPAPRYHAREVTLKLARETGATVVLGSATPDVGIYHRASQGEFQLLELPERIIANGPSLREDNGSAQYQVKEKPQLPQVQVVDMRAELREGNRGIFSRALTGAIDSALSSREQIILFINRRGTAAFIQCQDCGYSSKCKRCEVSLTYHSSWERLVCHHCGYNTTRPKTCQECGSQRLGYLGLGTQGVEEEMLRAFPCARLLRWDRDVTGGKHSHEEILQKFLSHEADVLIGTQMIAKGLHMPRVTLVGVISADVGINLPDFRAGERVFQVLNQVAGRAGRGPLGGSVIVQTFNPHHYAIEAAAHHDYAGFYKQELAYRRHHHYPPFSRLARLVYTHTGMAQTREESQRMAKELRREVEVKGTPNTDVLGPVPCYIPRVRGRHRWQILVRTSEPEVLLKDIPLPERWAVDIDPATLL